MEYKRNSIGSSLDDPPLSRLFIVGPKSLTEQDYRTHFHEFGQIDEIWMVNDKNTGEYKGITYIKYSKTSEAANALETMNGAILNNNGRRIKVLIAASREQGSKRDSNEAEKMQRLFIVCPKHMTDDDLHDEFKRYGELEYVSVVKDKQTRESKGIAFVKYYRFSDAARAFEECDRKYKAVFAEPKSYDSFSRRGEPKDFYANSSLLPTPSRNNSFSSFSPLNLSSPVAGPSGVNEGYTRLNVIASPDINQDQMWKLFDIVPGLDYCQVRYQGGHMRPTRAVGEVVYTSPQWAAHAKEKLHGFEYPPGFRLIVKPILEGNTQSPREGPDKRKDLMHIAETIAQASSLIQAAGLNPSAILNLGGISDSNSQIQCNVNLPDPKPLAGVDEECVARCFIVCTTPLPNTLLRDVFCRFGNLIEAYLLANKNCGYARYTDWSSCEQAIKTLHGADINGVRLKVMLAEEQRKRFKTNDDI
ncbi:RNA-binding protein 45 [Euwallacea similis]|uniref:RNA-binding protein 45 n=1 Tax=Euwallacea similis TaxID=1736056 RepID=UPI00344F2CDB